MIWELEVQEKQLQSTLPLIHLLVTSEFLNKMFIFSFLNPLVIKCGLAFRH